MTAIGATPEGGIDDAEVARRVIDITADPRLRAQYAATVRRWIIGPFHGGPADAVEVRLRALALVELAAGTADPLVPGAVAIGSPAPGSVDDPAYSSPTPVAGPAGTEQIPGTPVAGIPEPHAQGKVSAADSVVRDPAPGEVEQSTTGAEPELPEGRAVEAVAPDEAPPTASPVRPARSGRGTRRARTADDSGDNALPGQEDIADHGDDDGTGDGELADDLPVGS